MLATSRFIFVHLHKTGGQFINRLLLYMLPDARPILYHLPRAETPGELRHLPAIGFVRNPWDWYVSWYNFNAVNPLRNPIFAAVSDDGQRDFKQSIFNMLHLGCASHRLMRQRIINSLPISRDNNLGSGITKAIMTGFNDENAGYFSWLWRYMFFVDGELAGMHMGRMEDLRHDLIRLLDEVHQPLSIEQRNMILQAPAVNVSARPDYHKYYDDELRNIVLDREREFLGNCPYKF